ncbi:hypothetical protein MTO96_019428 [Rhipicephalus appendiculatus]
MDEDVDQCGRCLELGMPDMTALSRIDEDTINNNLRTRYRKDKIYQEYTPQKHWDRFVWKHRLVSSQDEEEKFWRVGVEEKQAEKRLVDPA